MDYYGYYDQKNENLEMYQRLIQYWSMTFNVDRSIYALDNMNFSRDIFTEIFSAQEIKLLHDIEPGYTSPDGYTELNELIRQLEYTRLTRYDTHTHGKEKLWKLTRAAGVGCGNGCTNVMNAVLRSIIRQARLKLSPAKGKPEVILALPNYTVYAAQLSNMQAEAVSKYVINRQANHFLPRFEDIREAVNERTAAVVITYPNNPAQATYEGENVEELKKITTFCREKGIFLVVDNVYQDVIFPQGRVFQEVFRFVDSPDYVIKVYGCSKDTPFYAGHRTGYWFGDPSIMESYKYYISATENSLNTFSLIYFALNLYFKMKSLLNAPPNLTDMDFFTHGVFGWSRTVYKEQLLEKFLELDLFEKYKVRINQSNTLQEEAIKAVTEFVKRSDIFCDYVNQNIGNVFFIKVNPEYFNKSDDDFFYFLYSKIKCGILPGSVFGISRDSKEVWFRITLIHDSRENILDHLSEIENLLKANSGTNGSKAAAWITGPRNKEETSDPGKEYLQVKHRLLDLNKRIKRNMPAVCQVKQRNFEKSGYTNVCEGFLDGKAIERVIIILRGSGCEWALTENGGCFMCGHLAGSSRGQPVPTLKIKQQFDGAVALYDFQEYPLLCLYNGGSFLNEKEIPAEARRYIFKKVNSLPHIKRFTIEARVEHVTNDILEEIQTLLPDTIVEIGVGLESSNPLVRNVILNKGTANEDYHQLKEKFQGRSNIKLLNYVLIKPPFLTEAEAIADAVSTIRFAWEMGAEIVYLEPVSIQDFTMVYWLWKNGYYRTPWIWSVFEIIKQTYHLGIQLRIGGFEFFPRPRAFVSNCPACDAKMIEKTKTFNMTNDLRGLQDINCPGNCHLQWKEVLKDKLEPDILSRINRILDNCDFTMEPPVSSAAGRRVVLAR